LVLVPNSKTLKKNSMWKIQTFIPEENIINKYYIYNKVLIMSKAIENNIFSIPS
jgi:hypothetical protein